MLQKNTDAFNNELQIKGTQIMANNKDGVEAQVMYMFIWVDVVSDEIGVGSEENHIKQIHKTMKRSVPSH